MLRGEQPGSGICPVLCAYIAAMLYQRIRLAVFAGKLLIAFVGAANLAAGYHAKPDAIRLRGLQLNVINAGFILTAVNAAAV